MAVTGKNQRAKHWGFRLITNLQTCEMWAVRKRQSAALMLRQSAPVCGLTAHVVHMYAAHLRASGLGAQVQGEQAGGQGGNQRRMWLEVSCRSEAAEVMLQK